MKNTLIAVLFAAFSISNTAVGDTTFGIGVGALYNGLGFNFGRTSEASLVYGSLGCMGASSSRSSSIAGDVVSRDSGYETNCGLGLGYLNLSLLPGNNHGLGLSIGYTYDTDDISGGSEYHVMPGYHYFFNGIGRPGLNLGFGARVTRSDEDSADTGLTFNLGYQF